MTGSTGRDELDLAILGGGPAGMSAALVAGRARLRATIVNAEAPRNAVTRASHGFLTRDGAHPLDLLALGREQLAKYETVAYLTATASSVSREENGVFQVDLEGSEALAARRVVLATGQRDDLSLAGLPGLEAVYGTSVFPCPFCDGWEHRDAAVAVFGGAALAQYAPVVRVWSEDLVAFTNGSAELDDDGLAALEGNGVRVVQEPVAQLISEGGMLSAVELEGGERVERAVGFVADDLSVPANSFVVDLGVGERENEWGVTVPDVSESGRSKVDGVYVIGDARSGFGGIAAAVAEGSACAESIVHETAEERWQAAG